MGLAYSPTFDWFFKYISIYTYIYHTWILPGWIMKVYNPKCSMYGIFTYINPFQKQLLCRHVLFRKPSPERGPNSMDSVSPKSQICGKWVAPGGTEGSMWCFVNLPSHEGSMYIYIYTCIRYIWYIWYVCTFIWLIFLVSLRRILGFQIAPKN